jgi:hypothetical protein
MKRDTEANIDLHFYSSMMEGSIDVSTLSQSIEAIQKIIYLLAMESKGLEFDQRARTPESIVSVFSLKCQIPKSGCYEFPMTLAYPQDMLPNVLSIPSVIIKLEKILGILVSGTLNNIQDTIISYAFREKIFDELKQLLPRKNSSWKLGIQINNKNINEFTDFHSKKVIFWIKSDKNLDTSNSIMGEILAVNFNDKTIKIRDNTTGRRVACSYSEKDEESLLSLRRNLVQFFGTVNRDQSGIPISIDEIVSFEKIRYEPIVIDEFTHLDLHLIANNKITLPVMIDPDTNQQYMVIDKDLGINVYGNKYVELEAEIKEQIYFLWKEYACCIDSELTKEAREIQINLKKTFSEEE